MLKSHLIAQLLKLLAAGLLLISFAMLSRRRTQRLITLYAWQGAILFLSTCLVAWDAGLTELWYSAALTLILKVVAMPWILHRLIQRLGAQWDNEPLVNIPVTMLATTITRHTIGVALAVILLSFLMMITRRKAITQVIGFLAMENGLFFAATSATYGMPMVIELGIALDLLVAVFILGVFFFQIREQFDSLDLHHLESLRED